MTMNHITIIILFCRCCDGGGCIFKVGEMFIVCGVLYAIDSATERNTKIVLGVDLYRGFVLSDVNLPFTNPFKNTTMALYNPGTKVNIMLEIKHYTTHADITAFILKHVSNVIDIKQNNNKKTCVRGCVLKSFKLKKRKGNTTNKATQCLNG